MDFKKNELINKTLDEFSATWSHTLDTEDFIDKKFLKKIDKYIYANLKKKFKEIEIYNLLYLQEKGFELGIFQKLKIYFSGLKPLYEADKRETLKQQRLCNKSKKKRKQAK